MRHTSTLSFPPCRGIGTIASLLLAFPLVSCNPQTTNACSLYQAISALVSRRRSRCGCFSICVFFIACCSTNTCCLAQSILARSFSQFLGLLSVNLSVCLSVCQLVRLSLSHFASYFQTSRSCQSDSNILLFSAILYILSSNK